MAAVWDWERKSGFFSMATNGRIGKESYVIGS